MTASTWLLAGLLPIALALHLSGAEQAGDQLVAYSLFGTAAVWGWQGLANLTSGVSRVFGTVYHKGPDALISPFILIVLTGLLTIVAIWIGRPHSDAHGIANATQTHSLPGIGLIQ